MDQQELVEYDLSFDGGVEALFSWQPGETKPASASLHPSSNVTQMAT